MTFPAFTSACFFSTDNGNTVGMRQSARDEQAHALPAGVTNVYRFDEAPPNNAGLIAAWLANAASFKMSGATVLVGGQPATFDPPGLVFTALQNAAALYAKAAGTADAFTRDEQAQLLALTFHALGLL